MMHQLAIKPEDNTENIFFFRGELLHSKSNIGAKLHIVASGVAIISRL
jgi:hypothetical protein